MDFETLGELGTRADETLPLLASIQGSGSKLSTAKRASAETCEALIRRIKALTTRLLPIQISDWRDVLTTPSSDVLTHEVVEAFALSAGDFSDALPYCLLEARRSFHHDALANPADYDENMIRRLACESIARRIVARAPVEKQVVLLCERYSHLSDGSQTLEASALETAVDQEATHFLSSGECSRVTAALWRGHLVQAYDDEVSGRITYRIYDKAGKGGFAEHLDPDRLGVPAYQNCFKIALWLLFIVAYAAALQTPERGFGIEDVILYVQWAGYLTEDVVRIYKVRTLQAIGFWGWVNFAIWTLLGIALAYRAADRTSPTDDLTYRRQSFMILSCAAPLIWAKVLTIFDLMSFFGVLQIVVARMLRESAVFAALLVIVGIGFWQSLNGMDVAESSAESSVQIVRTLIESILGSPAFDIYSKSPGGVTYPYGLVLYYIFCFGVLVILLNVLVALFSSAYAQVTDDAIASYMAFFAQKVVSAIRAPDQFVYCAPFNLIEICILPLGFCVSREAYATFNRYVMTVLFFPPLCCIALYESVWDRRKVQQHFNSLKELDDDSADHDPQASARDDGALSKVPFDELVKKFPDLRSSTATVTLKEIRALSEEVKELRRLLDVHGSVKRE